MVCFHFSFFRARMCALRVRVFSGSAAVLFVSNFPFFYFLFPKFTTDDCERTKGCFRSPQSCTTSDNCDFLVTYRPTNSTHVEFELSGRGAWIAVGFSNDRRMVGYLVDKEQKLIRCQSYPLLNYDKSIQCSIC